MTTSVKAIAGIGSLFAVVPTSYAVYYTLSSNNTPSRKRLENSGYSLEPPKLNPRNVVDGRYGCADRLFKEMKVSGVKPDPSDTTVYGCAIMFLETTQDDKFSDFNSHIAIRKGENGGIINVSVSSSGMMDYTYIELKYSVGEGTQESGRGSRNNTSNEITEKLIIKVPGDNVDGFNGIVSRPNNIKQTDSKKIKDFGKAGISNNEGSQKGILKGMMVAEGSEDKSQIFCSKETSEINECFQNLETGGNVRRGISEFTGAKKTDSSESQSMDIPKEKIKKAYQALSSSKGSGTELDNVCSYGKDGDIDSEQQKRLEMFCAVSSNKVTRLGFPDNYVPPLPSGEEGGSDLEVTINLPS